MSLFASPEQHAANPPATWEVIKIGRRWHLRPAGSDISIDSFPTRRQALAARSEGRWVDMYDLDGRWYAGEAVGWRPYADLVAERERYAARRAARVDP